jgi:hypothetical protein
MTRPGRWISLLPILALIPRLGLVIVAADRQQVAPGTRAALLWLSSVALAVLVGLAELYVGSVVVSRRHGGLAVVWMGITVLLNALILPLSLAGLEAVPLWNILGSRLLQAVWSAGLGLLSTLCIGGCLWADVVRDGSGLAEPYEAHLLRRISEEEALRSALTAKLEALQAQVERALSDVPPPTHAACELCGYWEANQNKVAGHVTQCRRRAARSEACPPALTSTPRPSGKSHAV